MAESNLTTKLLDSIKEEIDLLSKLSECFKALTEIHEMFNDERQIPLTVTKEQLEDWQIACYHTALWIPNKLAYEIQHMDEPQAQGGEA
jgi:hypothetical protein